MTILLLYKQSAKNWSKCLLIRSQLGNLLIKVLSQKCVPLCFLKDTNPLYVNCNHNKTKSCLPCGKLRARNYEAAASFHLLFDEIEVQPFLTFWRVALASEGGAHLSLLAAEISKPWARYLNNRGLSSLLYAEQVLLYCRTHREPTYPWYFPHPSPSPPSKRFSFSKLDLPYPGHRDPSTQTFSESSRCQLSKFGRKYKYKGKTKTKKMTKTKTPRE